MYIIAIINTGPHDNQGQERRLQIVTIPRFSQNLPYDPPGLKDSSLSERASPDTTNPVAAARTRAYERSKIQSYLLDGQHNRKEVCVGTNAVVVGVTYSYLGNAVSICNR